MPAQWPTNWPSWPNRHDVPADEEEVTVQDRAPTDVGERIDEQLRTLDDAAVDEHAAVYQQVHGDLAAALDSS